MEGRQPSWHGSSPPFEHNSHHDVLRRSIESRAMDSQEKALELSSSPERALPGRQEKPLGLASRWLNIYKSKTLSYWMLLFLSCFAMMTAFPASSILTRLYFVNGATSKWVISWLAAAGWPISAAFLLAYCVMEGENPSPLTWEMTLAYAVLGILSAADNVMFAYSYAYLPASTAALLASTSLCFTAILAYFMVEQKYNASIVNAVGIMTTAAVLLGLDQSSDRPFGVSSSQYTLGFILVICASALHGLIFNLSELLFIKLLGRRTFRVVLEEQTATSIFATIFTTIAVVVAGDFQKIDREAQGFKDGPGAYYQVFTWSAVSFQLGVLGSVGCLYLANTLLAGVLNAARVPATTVIAVIVFNDPMGGIKITAVILTIWSLVSYMWGSRSLEKEEKVPILTSPDASRGRMLQPVSNAA
ncbi:hypothetical protein Mapa_001236 [Marchantia paleacea]|nr:hypothetical protein Mapa_001236 [Marchantia paleacea]